MAGALAVGQTVRAAADFLVRYTVYPFDVDIFVDIFIERARFDQVA